MNVTTAERCTGRVEEAGGMWWFIRVVYPPQGSHILDKIFFHDFSMTIS